MGRRGAQQRYSCSGGGKKHVEVAQPHHFFKDCFRSKRVCVCVDAVVVLGRAEDGVHHLEQVRPITMSVDVLWGENDTDPKQMPNSRASNEDSGFIAIMFL